jgi:membrane protease YdiL (CAAX protease family)
MKKHPLVGFYLLAFGITWVGMVPGALGSHGIAPFDRPWFQVLTIFYAVGPALAALIVSRLADGKTGLQELFHGLMRWRVGPGWYLVSVLGPFVLFVVAQIITKRLGLSVIPRGMPVAAFPAVILVFAISLFANTCEEIGWRGFALPRLQKRFNALMATLVVGVLWGLWHLPLFLWLGQPMSESPIALFISMVANAFILTWIYNSTQGSIALVALFHFAGNVFGATVSGVSPVAYALVNVVVAITLLAVLGGENLSRRQRIRAS